MAFLNGSVADDFAGHPEKHETAARPRLYGLCSGLLKRQRVPTGRHSGKILSDGCGVRLEWVIISIGIVLRLAQYASNRSLWFDESLLALNIINRSFSDLLLPLDYHQGAPVGFLMVEKLAVQAFGNSEYTLRLFPLLAGIASLYFFDRILKLCIERKAGLIALGLFALSSPHIYYSSEVKQYSSDVAISLSLLVATLSFHKSERSISNVAGFALVGATALWFSHPAVFVLAGVGLCLAGFAVSERNWAHLGSLSTVFSVWGLSLAACYVLSLRHLGNDPTLIDVWRDAFLPWPPWSYWAVAWGLNKFFALFMYPVGLSLSGLGVFAFLIGCCAPANITRAQRLIVVISPALPTLAATALHRYPFEGRFLLFLAPSLLLFIGNGAEQVRVATGHQRSVAGFALIALLFFHPLWDASYNFFRPPAKEEIRPVIEYVKEHKRTGDALYLYWRTEAPFQYYLERWDHDASLSTGRMPRRHWFEDMETLDSLHGSVKVRKLLSDLDTLRGNRRVWLVFSHVRKDQGVDDDQLFLYYLDALGTRLDAFVKPGSSAYLYDLTKDTAHPSTL
jgi:hypothetical protein